MPPDDDSSGPKKPKEEGDGQGEDDGDPMQPNGPHEPVPRIKVKLADGKDRRIRYIAATTYIFNGKPITVQEFMDQLFGDLGRLVTDEDDSGKARYNMAMQHGAHKIASN